MNYCLKVVYMNHLLFSFKNINVKIRILDCDNFEMICFFATDSICVQKLIASDCFDNEL